MMLTRIKAFFSTPLFNYGRALIYVALPLWLLDLVKQGKLTQDHANLWNAVVLAAAGPALSAIFAPNGWRTYLFALAAPVQGLLTYYGAISHNALGMLVIALLNSVALSGLAASNVHRSEMATTDTKGGL